MKKSEKLKTLPKEIYIKYVKRANMWCKTYTKDGKQIIEWFSKKPV